MMGNSATSDINAIDGEMKILPRAFSESPCRTARGLPRPPPPAPDRVPGSGATDVPVMGAPFPWLVSELRVGYWMVLSR
jgi:hypothetical protein